MKSAARAWIRRVSAALIVAFLAAVAFLGYQRTRGNGEEPGVLDADTVGFDAADVAVGLYRGFRHTETLKGRPLFILDSLKTLSLASGWQEIEGVRLQLFQEGEPGPVLTAERASYNIESRDARLEGGIHVEFPDGAFLNTDAGHFRSKNQVFDSEAPVLYVDGATFGQAQRASYDLAQDRIKLEGNAAFHADDGTLITAPYMIYRRDERRVLMSEGVALNRGPSKIRAPRAVVELGEKDGPPKTIQLLGGVSATTIEQASGAVVNMWSDRVTAELDARGNWQVDARSNGPWVEVRFLAGPGYYERVLQTQELGAVVGVEGLISLQTDNGVCLSDVPEEGPPRRAQAKAARAWFRSGLMTDVELDGEVEITAGAQTVNAERARLVQDSGLVMVQADPTGKTRVRLRSERGRMTCDQANIFDREGRVEARGQVNGELEGARLFGAADPADDNEPVRFASNVVEATEEGATTILRDNARVWQGHRLLLADSVIYRHDSETVTARGHVRATFPADQMDPEGDAAKDVVVVARALDYEATDHRAEFRGSVHYADPRHSLSASRLVVLFDEDNRISDVEAEGAVEINDLATGRRLTGQRAHRVLASQVITVTGSPAQLIDERGNVASGDSLTWNQADGTVSIGGGTELIYYPEDPPEPESPGSRRP
jgi:lipopolysaccharide export system protein LptA